jgi:dCMP deaminase
MRPTWDEYFMDIAVATARRSTCNRKQVGCVLTKDHRILSTGYGGSIAGQPHCVDVGCDIDPKTGGCIRTVHAEINAILQCARHGVSTLGSTAYVTLSPCQACFKALASAGAKRIVYLEEYRIPPSAELAKAAGVEMIHLKKPGHPVSFLAHDWQGSDGGAFGG